MRAPAALWFTGLPGSGKTTLAVHLAVLAESLGHRVAIIDTDPQKSAADWWRARKISRPAMAECEPKNLAKALRVLKTQAVRVPPSVRADSQLPRLDGFPTAALETRGFWLRHHPTCLFRIAAR